ncbi:hypothetical protein [Paenibacillus xylanilyticus]|uniref:hypothetical protein n=1 Tax=Paenibacillus xylanilyticus TaxID=248903 RepID=UPI0039A38C65
MKATFVSSNLDLNDLAYLGYLLLSIVSLLTFQKSTRVEGMKQRACEKYKAGYHLKSDQKGRAAEEQAHV